ncbi:MAG: ribokinase [Candidatus Limnocylindria bacterium]
MNRSGAPGRVIVVGSVNIDLVVAVAHLPAAGETVIGGRFSRHHGGKGGNQAVAAARLGANVAFVGAVGDDAFGREAHAALQAEGVDTTELLTLTDTTTGVALILVDTKGENSIAVASGANAALTSDRVRAALDRLRPTAGDVVLVGHEIPTATAGAALQAGRDAGAITVLNPAPAAGLDAATVAFADIITPNKGELAELRRAAVAGPVALVTLGADGARLDTPDGPMAIPALPVLAVDTVGAGDTLNGALAAGLAAGMALPDASRRAVAAASLAVTRAGAREGMPTRAELDQATRT